MASSTSDADARSPAVGQFVQFVRLTDGVDDIACQRVDVDFRQTAVNHGSGFGLHAVGQIASLSGREFVIEENPDTGGARTLLSLPTPTATEMTAAAVGATVVEDR